MGPFEPGVDAGQAFHDMLVGRDGQRLDLFQPVPHHGRHQRMARWNHSTRKEGDIVLTKRARRLLRARVRVRGHVPHRSHRQPMNLTDLGEGQQRPRRLVAGVQRLLVDPAGRLCITRDLQVLGKLMVADRSSAMQQPVMAWPPGTSEEPRTSKLLRLATSN
jgi:hypothetical protein